MRRSVVLFLSFVFDHRNGAFLYVFKTTLFAFSGALILLIPVALTGSSGENDPLLDSGVLWFVSNLVAAPIFENLAMVFIVELSLAYGLKKATILAIVAALATATHALAGGWRAVSGFALFPTMAYSYLTWRDGGFNRRFAITLAQHVLFNLPATVSLAFLR